MQVYTQKKYTQPPPPKFTPQVERKVLNEWFEWMNVEAAEGMELMMAQMMEKISECM